MAQCIKAGALLEDTWVEVSADTPVPADGDVILPLARWVTERSQMAGRRGRTGVRLEPADDPAVLAQDAASLDLIAVHFPVFTDGRGYSSARLLRQRYGFTGELRAVGDVQRDQLFYLARCGFDAFALRGDQDVQACLEAFRDFTEAYQAGADRGPLFDRRVAARGVAA